MIIIPIIICIKQKPRRLVRGVKSTNTPFLAQKCPPLLLRSSVRIATIDTLTLTRTYIICTAKCPPRG